MNSPYHFGFIIPTNIMPKLKLAWVKVPILLLFFTSIVAAGKITAQDTHSVTATNTAVWTGASSNDWCNAANWSLGKIPDETTNITIPAGTVNMPVVTCSFSFNAYSATIDIQPGATLTIPTNRTLNLFGELISRDEKSYVLKGRVNFAGNNQVIPGLTYNNLTVSGGGIKTVATNAVVNGSLILTKGIISTGPNNLITIGEKGMVTAGYHSSYIDGPLKRLTNSTRSYNFPVGAQGKIKTVLVTPEEETEGAYTVYYHQAIVPDNGVFGCTNLLANVQNEFWDITRSQNASNALVQVDYTHSISEGSWSNKKQPTELSKVALIQNNEGSWSYKADASLGLQSIESIDWQSNGQLAGKLETDFSHFTFGYGYTSVLPVTIHSFSASLVGKTSKLSWSVEQGKDWVITELQHGTDEKHFEKLASVEAGNSGVINYNHYNLTTGMHWYRLMIKDKARNISYSKTIRLTISDNKTTISGLNATLVRNEAGVKVESASNQPIGISLFDMSGHLVTRQIKNIIPGDNKITINTMMVTPGIYNMHVQTADGVIATLRFMKE